MRFLCFLLILTAAGCVEQQARPNPHAAGPNKKTVRQLPPIQTPASTPNSNVALERLKGNVVLVTHPTPSILRSFKKIVDAGAIKMPITLVGVRHADEGEKQRYAKSATIADKHPWIQIKTISCPLTPATVYRENACTSEFKALFRHSSAVVFTGGADIPPSLYGQKTRLTTMNRTPRRIYWEVSFLTHLLGSSRAPKLKPLLGDRPDYPVIGICLGMQMMNVATGGTLHQDILTDLYKVTTYEDAQKLSASQLHRNNNYFLRPTPGGHVGVYHPVRFTEAAGPLLAAWGVEAKQSVRVMSIHHQAVDRLGRDLQAIASSTDGKVVEGLRHKRFENVVGVQFHPEYHFLGTGKSFATIPVDDSSNAFHRRFWESLAKRLKPVGDNR